MAVRLITYDLNKETTRPNITGAIKKEYPAWAQLSESSYAVSTSATVEQIYAKLKPLLDENDYIYIITLTRPYTGFGNKKVNDWLESELAYSYV